MKHLFLSLFCVFALASVTSGTVIFNDTFTDTDLTRIYDHTPDIDVPGNGWTERIGTTVVNLNQSQGLSVSANNIVSWLTSSGDADVTVKADITIGGATTAGTNAAPAVAVRYDSSTDTGYIVLLNRAANELTLWKLVNATPVILDTEAMTVTAGETYTVEVVADGTTITGTVGSYSVSATNQTDYQTYVHHGIRSIDNGDVPRSRVDNFIIDESTAPTADSISITYPSSYRVHQRDDSGKASIVISGAYTGTPTAIEASWNGGAYTTIVASPTGGTYSGTLTAQSQGQGTLTVRFVNDTLIAAAKSYVGIGEVFIVAGQSNAECALINAQSYSHATIKASVYRQSGGWAELTDPTDSDTTAGSIWPLLATEVMADQGVPVAFITTADTGTGLLSPDADWNPPSGGSFVESTTMVAGSRITNARAILWYQGERDANNAQAQSTYQSAMSSLLDALQTSYGFDTKMVAAQLAMDVRPSRDELNAIRLAQAYLWANDADILPGPVTMDVDLSDEGGDSLHFKTDVEAQTLANRWWYAIDRHFYAGTIERGPQVLGFERHSTDTVRAYLSVGNGSLTGQTDSTGWRIEDSAGVVSSLSAVAVGSDMVDITVNRPLVGNVVASWGSYNDAIGSTLKDGSILPPEPVVDVAVYGKPTAAFMWR